MPHKETIRIVDCVGCPCLCLNEDGIEICSNGYMVESYPYHEACSVNCELKCIVDKNHIRLFDPEWIEIEVDRYTEEELNEELLF